MRSNQQKTFADAAASYIEHGGDGRHLPKIIEELGDRHLAEVVPFDVRELASKLYPDKAAATRNRHVITPIRAVMYHAYDRGWGPVVRIRQFREEAPKRKKAASQAWLHAFIRQCDLDNLPHVAGLVMMMSQTGARVSEAVALRWAQVDLVKRQVLLLKTKTSTNSTRYLTDQLAGRLGQMAAGKGPDDRVFRYTNRLSVNERIAAVCRRAGITYKPSHTCGRHAFANNAMALGADIKSTMQAGGWKSTSIFLGVYVNPQNAGRAIAEKLNVYQYDSDL